MPFDGSCRRAWRGRHSRRRQPPFAVAARVEGAGDSVGSGPPRRCVRCSHPTPPRRAGDTAPPVMLPLLSSTIRSPRVVPTVCGVSVLHAACGLASALRGGGRYTLPPPSSPAPANRLPRMGYSTRTVQRSPRPPWHPSRAIQRSLRPSPLRTGRPRPASGSLSCPGLRTTSAIGRPLPPRPDTPSPPPPRKPPRRPLPAYSACRTIGRCRWDPSEL